MQWQYLIIAIISISAALIAVRVDHWLSRKYEYRKARSSVKDEIDTNISICDLTLRSIDDDLNGQEEGKMSSTLYVDFRGLAWNTWKNVILLGNSKIGDKIEAAYVFVAVANILLHRVEEFKWGVAAASFDAKRCRRVTLESSKHCISERLLPYLKEAQGLLEKGS